MFFVVLNFSVAQDTPTWNDNIACIMFSHCIDCHHSEGIGPFSLTNYDDAKIFADQILQEVETRRMPPYLAWNSEQEFVAANKLTEEEIDIIRNWVNAGSPEGDISNTPDEPVIGSDIEIQNPDLEITLPLYTVPELSENDLYRCFVVPVEFETDQYITGVEVIPGNTKAVHHVLLYQEESDIVLDFDAQDPGEGYTCFGGIGTNTVGILGGWAPGGSASYMPDGMGLKIANKTNLVIQIHYPYYAWGESDQTKINLLLENGNNMRELRTIPILNHFTAMTNGPLFIPANQERTFNQEWVSNFPLTLTGITPHAHLICTSMKAWAELPDGQVIELVNIEEWNFEWQKFYNYKYPVVLPAGTRIKSEATYDNTVNNHHQPNFPPQDVNVGEATGDEMMVFFLTFDGYQAGDEDLVFSTEDHVDHYDDCNASAVSTTQLEIDNTLSSIYPNPVSNILNLDYEAVPELIEIYSASGLLIKEYKNVRNTTSLDVSKLNAGSYVLKTTFVDKIVSINKFSKLPN